MQFLKKIIITSVIFLSIQGCQHISQPPDPDSEIDFSGCIVPGSSTRLEIVTFNTENFPKEGSLTIDATARLIKAINPDVVAFQEITSEASFNNLLKKLPGWTGQYYLINNADWNLAFIFKDSEIIFDKPSARILFTDDFYAFPRPPLEVKITHKPTGISAWLINLHLKCCGGSDNIARRRDAANKLYNYILSERNNDPVVLLGDWNDVITSMPEPLNPFYVFLNDTQNFRFADISIASGTSLWWSYPSYPSHIDHILVTNELFKHVDTTITIKPDPCYASYFSVISDHRPVGVIIK